jgi:hypothetical protein
VTTAFTVLDDGQAHTLQATRHEDRILLTPESVAATLGWRLTPEGLCHGEVCLPTRGHADRLSAAGLDLDTLAAALDRPLAVEPAAHAAALGTSVGERAARLRGLAAPPLTLDDLDGLPHRLDGLRPKKVFLLAFASW